MEKEFVGFGGDIERQKRDKERYGGRKHVCLRGVG